MPGPQGFGSSHTAPKPRRCYVSRLGDSKIFRQTTGWANITWLYRFTLSILKQHPDRRMSLIMKRRGCGWSDKFLMEIINALIC